MSVAGTSCLRQGLCCQPDAWERYVANPYGSAQPLDERTISAAWAAGLDPHLVDNLVESEWGWESHDQGYADAVRRAVEQLAAGRGDSWVCESRE